MDDICIIIKSMVSINMFINHSVEYGADVTRSSVMLLKSFGYAIKFFQFVKESFDSNFLLETEIVCTFTESSVVVRIHAVQRIYKSLCL